MDQWKSGWETKERVSLAKKEKEQHSGSILKIKEKKEKLGEERKNHVEGLQGKKMGGGGGGEKKTGAGKKLSWADGQGPWKEERKKERKGRSVPKSENFVKKAEHSGGEDKSEKLSSKAEYSAEEDDLTKVLSLLAPPPKIQIPESLDPSKVKLFCI